MSNKPFHQVDHYLNQLFSLEDEVLSLTEKSIVENGMPEHSVSANQGQFLFFLSQLCGAQTIIEVGTLGGYSTIWLGRAVQANGGKVISIEVEKMFAEVAQENIKNAGLENTVEIIHGNAMEALNRLELNGKPVDLFFMDADKPNYINYFNWALQHARKGSLIIADNVIRDGKILDENSRDEKVIGVQNYLSMLAKHPQLNHSVLQQVGSKDYDGIAITMVK